MKQIKLSVWELRTLNGLIGQLKQQGVAEVSKYGNLKENLVTNSQGETLDVKKVVNERNGYRYKEELGTNPRVFYLPRRQG